MAQLSIDVLDVGSTKYGDCILVRGDGKAILIDGAHQGDMKDKENFVSIPNQLDALFGTARPHKIDMLVVTHAHADHIGCLPELVDQNVIRCDMAYVADEDLGWSAAQDAIPDARAQAAMAVLREEDGLAPTADAFGEIVADALKLRERYANLLTALDQQGRLIRCTGSENRTSIEQKFSGLGLKILGPTKRHLETCHAQIESFGRDLLKVLQAGPLTDSTSVTDLVRDAALADEGALLDQFGAGSALNDQSIVLAFEFGGRKVLLPGDMQFAEHQVTDLDDEMKALRRKVKQHGPYDIVKTSHHTSYNGWNDAVAEEQAIKTREVFLVHTGGRNDPKHPEDGALSAIRTQRQGRSKPLTFVRTDRNGAIAFTISSTGKIEFTKQKGRINDFRANTDLAFLAPAAGTAAAATAGTTPPIGTVTQQAAAASSGGGVVEVTARVPHVSTRVTLTIDVAPGAVPARTGGALTSSSTSTTTPTSPQSSTSTGPTDPSNQPLVSFSLPTDRTLPPLLFLTDGQALAQKIGAANVEALVKTLVDAGQGVLNIQAAGVAPRDIARAIRGEMNGVSGVVLIGDLDVLPAERFDVLPPDLRQALSDPEGDPDNFIVWNDEVYGTLDDDEIADLPVSRIPDGGSAQTLANALRANGGAGLARFGIRNVARPFADVIFKKVSKKTSLRVSHPLRHTDFTSADVGADLVYIMLHGLDTNTSKFWGETASASPIEAINVAQVPASFSGVVLAGCCWGALTASQKAVDASPGASVSGRSAGDSLAVAFVNAGARAFVGCTGVHYSPTGTSIKSAGAPMHDAFLSELVKGAAPAQALFNAKRTCLKQIQAAGSPEELAVGLKIIRQFTCLGLGW